jgi:2-methylcitrate dehydratase PrpD
LALVRENDIKPEQIEEVIIGVDVGAMHYCEPISVRHYPRNVIDLQFSIPYNVANAIINGKVGFEHFTEKALKDRDVLELLSTRVRSWVDPEVNFDEVNKACTAARIQIKTKDGKLYVKRVDKPKGDYTNPLTIQKIIDKFWDCAELLAKPIPRQNLKKLLELITDLEKLGDVTSIVRLLTY